MVFKVRRALKRLAARRHISQIEILVKTSVLHLNYYKEGELDLKASSKNIFCTIQIVRKYSELFIEKCFVTRGSIVFAMR